VCGSRARWYCWIGWVRTCAGIGRAPKHEVLEALRDFLRARVAMTDYSTFRQLGYDCGSGPTESLCGRLTDRLKGPGMRWD
jgi:hypothetical protein